MVYKNTLEAVIENVKEIENLVSGFAGYEEIPAIDMDLALEKVRNLYDILLILKQSGQEKGTGKTSLADDKSVTAEKTGKDDNVAKDVAEDTNISDRFKSESSSIHDSFAKLEQNDDLSSQLQTKPISNIADAIGINDKFTFIKELFDSDVEKYNTTIDILNKVVNFNDAYNYLMGNFDWDMDSPMVQKILNLIRRKLIINKDE